VPDLLKRWDYAGVGKPIHLIFGAFRRFNGCYFNSLYWLYDGVVQSYFDKRHAMIVSERLPFVFSSEYIRSIYFSKDSQVTQGQALRPQLIIGSCGTFVPYICSELFFNEKPDDQYDPVPIIVIVNDSMFLSSQGNGYMRKLLVLVARFKALMWKRDVVYASYGYGLLIDKSGGMRDLIR
jgi:hypothetical protein